MDEITKLLEDRGSDYGSYEDQVTAITEIMNQLKNLRNQKNGLSAECWITREDTENFFLVLKLCRAQTSKGSDSFLDLEAYSRLIRERRFGKDE